MTTDSERLDWLIMKSNSDELGLNLPFGLSAEQYRIAFRQSIDTLLEHKIRE